MKCDLCDKEFKNLSGLNSHYPHCQKTIILKNDVIEMYKNNNSIRDISEKLFLSKSKVAQYLENNVRSLSEANILSHKLYPEKFKHSETTKEIIRQKRLQFMKENPEKTAWRLSNLSYPEKLFLKKLIDLKWDKLFSINREKCVFPYYIDFAFENEKVAVEIDGSQHSQEDRKNKDANKDKLLNNNGWQVVRIPESKIKYDIDKTFSELFQILKNSKKDVIYMNGIIINKKTYVKKERNIDGFTEEQIKSFEKQRKMERPTYEQLILDVKEIGYRGTGRKYGVCDNSIKKWIKHYEKYKN